jgi:hypothetical protein
MRYRMGGKGMNFTCTAFRGPPTRQDQNLGKAQLTTSPFYDERKFVCEMAMENREKFF